MSTKYIASNWRLPNEENSNKSDNYGLSFDGSSEHINVSANSIFNFGTGDFTLSAWIKVDSFSPSYYPYILDFRTSSMANERAVAFYLDDNGILQVWIEGSLKIGSSGTALAANTWHNVILKRESGTLSTHINGGSADQTVTYTGNMNTTPPLTIGARAGNIQEINGAISQVSIFNYALSSTQISTLYGSSSLGAGNPMALKPAPVAFYNLGDNTSGGLLPNPSPPPTNISILTQPNEAVEDASVFDFSSDSISVPNNTAFDFGTGDFTWSFWLNVDNHVNYAGLLYFATTGAPYRLKIQSDSTIYLDTLSNDQQIADLGIGLAGSGWHNLIFVRNSGVITTFLDGQQVDSVTYNYALNSGGLPLIIGNNAGQYFDGQISNVVLWNSDQSSEISNIYNSGVPATSYTNTPTAWYKLDQSANWEADSSGNWQIPDAVSAYPQSFDFDGSSSQFINNGYFNELDNSDLSFSIWLKKTNTDYAQVVDSQTAGNSGILIAINSSDQVFVRVNTLTASTTTSGFANIGFQRDKWQNIILTYNNTTRNLIVYLNNQSVSNTTGSLTTKGASLELKIGGVSGSYFTGQISNAQIYNIELSSTQVETLYNNGVPLTTAIASDNLKLWSKLDNTATFSTNWSIPDASGNGNTGTSSGMTEQNLVNNNVSALNGESSGMTSASLVLSDLSRNVPYDSYSFNFDAASSDYILTTFAPASYTGFSISAWVYADSLGSFNVVASQYRNGTPASSAWFLETIGSNMAFGVANGAGAPIYATKAFSTLAWHHIVGVWNGSNVEVYIDGVASGSPQSVSGMNTGTVNMAIGGLWDSGGATVNLGFWDGKISNLSIFNEALTSTEVLKLYANGVPQDLSNFTPAPVSWWTLGSNSFWNGSNWICRDLIGSNDGTSANAGADAIVGDAPRSEANGTGTNMDIPTNLEGSTKWSSNNSWSINMSSTARVEDTP